MVKRARNASVVSKICCCFLTGFEKNTSNSILNWGLFCELILSSSNTKKICKKQKSNYVTKTPFKIGIDYIYEGKGSLSYYPGTISKYDVTRQSIVKI